MTRLVDVYQRFKAGQHASLEETGDLLKLANTVGDLLQTWDFLLRNRIGGHAIVAVFTPAWDHMGEIWDRLTVHEETPS